MDNSVWLSDKGRYALKMAVEELRADILCLEETLQDDTLLLPLNTRGIAERNLETYKERLEWALDLLNLE